MARYPTFEEYQKSGNYDDGLKRANELLKKAPKDPELMILKAQLAVAKDDDPLPTIDEILSLQPPLQDLSQLVAIEQVFIDVQRNEFPAHRSTGPKMAKLWENALKSPGTTTNYKLDLLSLRFSQGIANNRLEDAQQALIQLKAMQPRNRVLYMAHAAVTQLLSTSKDDLQARLALMLAKKAVKERFDDDKDLDCRVAGQILAVSGTKQDLEGIKERPRLGESKQVYDAVRRAKEVERNGDVKDGVAKSASLGGAADAYEVEVAREKERFAALITSDAKTDEVIAFVSDAVRLYHQGWNSTVGDRRRLKVDACFLAISGLVRAYELTVDSAYLMNAAHIAETLLKQNEHIHEARLILVYLYMRLGLGSLALKMFESLSVKEIQHDTVGHALFTRLSLIHPFPTEPTKKELIAPLKKTGHALQVYVRCEDKLAETEAGALAHCQTGMIFDLHELRDSLRTSLTRRITFLEQRRIDRLLFNETGRSVVELGPQVVANWIQATDNRDFAATFNFGYKVEKVLHSYNGSIPGTEWMLYALVADAAWCLALGKPPPVTDLHVLLEKTEQALPDTENLQISVNRGLGSSMYSTEYRAGHLACRVLKLLLHLHDSDADLTNDIAAISAAVEALDPNGDLFDIAFTTTEGLLDCYAYIDVLRIADKAISFARSKSTTQDEALVKLQKVVRNEFSSYGSLAKKRLARLKNPSIKEAMVIDSKIAEAEALFGSQNLDLFCKAVADSAKEGWEGVGKVRLA
ncbi:hypothetical protein LTR09_010459 [Extremus antarcticus]|uniref:Actin cytoskeleton organization protein n=1 Tax=Extremus antarcticus TaxID=702011 RepID=A0AAJ0G510_9PEZI|nr:hypothetical protein LTR09_010459 [Extremus antarcticus]